MSCWRTVCQAMMARQALGIECSFQRGYSREPVPFVVGGVAQARERLTCSIVHSRLQGWWGHLLGVGSTPLRLMKAVCHCTLCCWIGSIMLLLDPLLPVSISTLVS